MSLYTLLNNNNFFTVNREMAKKVGLNASIFLSELIDKYCYFESMGLEPDGWFYLKIEDVYDRTSLGRDAQDGAIKKLKALGLIECKQMGMPAKRHFRLSRQKIEEIASSLRNPANKIAESRKQDCNFSANKIEEFPQTAPYIRTLEKPKKQPLTPSRGKDAAPPVRAVLIPYGTYVKMKEEDYKLLCKDNDRAVVDGAIEEINDYIASTGRKPYKDYAATIRNWLRRRKNGKTDSTPRSHSSVDPKSNEGHPEAFVDERSGWAKTNLELAQKAKSILARRDEGHLLDIWKYSVVNRAQNSISIDFKLPPDTFADILSNWFQLKGEL